jgi:glutamyl-Q tRNA(Asp) synthetase
VSPPGAGFVTRFAPSPTGYLHQGHAFSALTAHWAARAAGGRFLLRIEDIDRTRARPEFEAAILEDLAWLGLNWEQPVRRQSAHMDDYAAALERLRAAGLLYRCFRTRKELAEAAASAPHGPAEGAPFRGEPLPAPEEAALIAAGRPFAWRLSMAAARQALGPAWDTLGFVEEGAGPAGEQGWIAVDPASQGDVILARKDVGVAYHLAVVVDDALQGVTHVLRGNDLFEATHVQRLLQALLGLPTPAYRHHRLLLGPDGRRLAKRNGAESLRELRARGVAAARLRRELGFPSEPWIAGNCAPSTRNAAPLTKRAWAESRNTTTPAISSGAPQRLWPRPWRSSTAWSAASKLNPSASATAWVRARQGSVRT